MSEQTPLPKIREVRGTRLEQAELDIDKINERLSNLGERVASLESDRDGFRRSLDSLLRSFDDMRKDIGGEMGQIHKEILGTFSRMFWGLSFISIISICGIAAVVGGSLYLRAFGFELGSGATQATASVPEAAAN